MEHRRHYGFWVGVQSALRLAPAEPQSGSVLFRGRDIACVTASESVRGDWQSVFGDLRASANGLGINESGNRTSDRFSSSDQFTVK